MEGRREGVAGMIKATEVVGGWSTVPARVLRGHRVHSLLLYGH